jgi:hypothetical protein
MVSSVVRLLAGDRIIADGGAEFLLPPSELRTREKQVLAKINPASDDNYYFCGWLFRNPVGLEKYRQEIKELLAPRPEYAEQVKSYMAELRRDFRTVVGVHIRRGDYRTFAGGSNFYDWSEVSKILQDFLVSRPAADRESTVFLLCSDEAVEPDSFSNLRYRLAPGHELLDLYLLAESDLIIGANSTYGAWAAYYGQVPFVNFSRSAITWPEPLRR